jgi:hypothetical protein
VLIYYFTTPHQLGKKEKPSVFLSRQFSTSLEEGLISPLVEFIMNQSESQR